MAFDVFISYAHEDKTIADAVCGTLEANRIRCWIAPRDVLPSVDWGEAVLKAINDCYLIVLVFSSKSNVSEHVKNEIERAVSGEKPVIPFRVEEVKPSGSLALHLSRRHWLDAITAPIEKHLNKLVEIVELILSSKEEKREKPVDASEEYELKPRYEAVEAPKSLLRRKGIISGIVFAMLCIIITVFLLNRPGKHKTDVLSPVDQTGVQITEIKRPSEKPIKSPEEPIESSPEPEIDISTELDLGIKAFDQGDYDRCITHMKKVLEEDLQNTNARDYRARAEKKLVEADQPGEQITEIKPPSEKPIKSPEEPIESPPEPEIDISTELDLGIKAFDQGDYDRCITHMKKVLEEDPQNINARDYRARAENKLIEQEIKDSLKIAQEAFQREDYQECIDQTKRVLELDPENTQARKYLNQANLNIAPVQIREVVRQYIQSLNSDKLLTFYKNTCSSEIYPNLEKDTKLILDPYNSFQSMASKITIRFEGINQAEISFVHIITGASKKDGKRKELFRGILKWVMEKQDENWKILAISFHPDEEK